MYLRSDVLDPGSGERTLVSLTVCLAEVQRRNMQDCLFGHHEEVVPLLLVPNNNDEYIFLFNRI